MGNGLFIDRTSTMYDFHDFGLPWKCHNIFPCGCTITSKAKINIFSTLRVPFRHPPFEKISNNVDFSLWDKQCICAAKMRPKSWKSHIVQTLVVVVGGEWGYVLKISPSVRPSCKNPQHLYVPQFTNQLLSSKFHLLTNYLHVRKINFCNQALNSR